MRTPDATAPTPQTLAQKLIARAAGLPVVREGDIVNCRVDLAMVHDSSGPRRLKPMLEELGAPIWDKSRVVLVMDHFVPEADEDARRIVRIARDWARDQALPHVHDSQGICHVVLPQKGHLRPGLFCVGGDSHSPTGGAFGCYMFGIGSTEMLGVVVTGEIWLRVPHTLRMRWEGALADGVCAKDMMLHMIGRFGMNGGGYQAVEFAGSTVRGLGMAERMTLSNMSAEMGAQAGLIAPDQTTFDYIAGTPNGPKGEALERALAWWKTLPREAGAHFDTVVRLAAHEIAPQVTWGTNPEAVLPITGVVPNPADEADEAKRAQMERMVQYMGLTPGQRLQDLKVDVVFIGSCTNSRIEDIRAAAAIAKGRKVADGVRAMVVPGSGLVKKAAEAEGLDRILQEAGFEWREAGCSMCLGMNPDKLTLGQRSASTSNRNFEGRQGAGGRIYLLSPAMAAAAAVSGHLADVRDYQPKESV